jgi:hypothetical protein
MLKLSGKIFFITGFLTLLVLTIVLAACDNIIGLGGQINTEVPVINLSGNNDDIGVGSFLYGRDNKIYFDVDQPFGLREVFASVWYDSVPDFDQTALGAQWDTDKGQWKRRLDAQQVQDNLWRYNIDTEGMADGQIFSRITAIDISGRTTTTTEIIYIVKNIPPEIELTLPRINKEDFDTNLIAEPQLIIQGNDLMGIAADLAGIKSGYPQIMMWYEGFKGQIDNDEADEGWDREFGQWHTMVDANYNKLILDSHKTVQFRWPLYKLQNDTENTGKLRPVTRAEAAISENFLPVAADGAVITYYFKIRVRDKFNRTNIYPYRTNHELKPEQIIPDVIPSGKIAIQLTAMTNPIITVEHIDRFYNRKGDFTADIRVRTVDAINQIRAAVHTNTIFNFPQDNDFTGILATLSNDIGSIEDISDYNTYRITIPRNRMSELENREYFLHIEVKDRQGKQGFTFLSFTIDDIAPSLQYIQPVGLEAGLTPNLLPEVTGTTVFKGLTTDNLRVVKMYYVLGRTEVNNAVCESANCKNSAENNIHCENQDCIWIDTFLEDRMANKPQIHNANGVIINVRWSGSLSNWNLTFPDITDVVRWPVLATEADGNYYVTHYGNTYENLWVLPIKFKVVDEAGNVHIETVQVIVDPDADLPKVEIISHSNTLPPAVVGGEVRLAGTAEDNDWVHSVWIRAYKINNTDLNITDKQYIPLTQGAVQDSWTEVNYSSENKSSFISWFFNLNSNNFLDQTSNESQLVLIELRATDALAFPQSAQQTPKSEGRIKPLILKFSNTVPRVTNVQLIRGEHIDLVSAPREPYDHGVRVSGFVTLVVRVQDDLGLSSIMWNGQGGAGLTEVINNTNTTSRTVPFVVDISNELPGTNVGYDLYIPLNTNTIRNSYYANHADNYTLNIQVSDNNDPVQTLNNTYLLQIDNYFPFASFTGNKNALGLYRISGRTWDRELGTNVHGIEKIVVYFSRPSNGVPLFPVNAEEQVLFNDDFGTRITLWENAQIPDNSIFAGYTAGWAENKQAMVNRKGNPPPSPSTINQGVIRNLPFFPDVQQNGVFKTTNSGIVITTGNADDGYQKSFSGDSDINWFVDFDTTRLKDGPVYVNYVVFDKAGNVTYNKEVINIANNRPQITGISLGTDIVGAMNNGSSDFKDFDYIDNFERHTGFRIRNNTFHLKMNVSTVNGNHNFNGGTLKYSVSYVEPDGTTAVLQQGRAYTIINVGTNIPWIDYGVFGTPAVGFTFTASKNVVLPSNLVMQYKTLTNPNTRKEGAFLDISNTLGTSIIFTADSFNNSEAADRIPDSEKNAGGDILPANHNRRLFLIKVFDGANSAPLYFTTIIALDIDNTDLKKPEIDVAPFGQEWTSAGIVQNNDSKLLRDIAINDNGFLNEALYNKNIVTGARFGSNPPQMEKKGYVQYSMHKTTPDTNADVSGKVIFTGRVYDNRRICRITVKIDGANSLFANETTIALWNDAAAAVLPVNSNTIANMSEDGSAKIWGFEAVNQYITLDYGHVLDWKFAWDSSSITNQNGVVVTFKVYDAENGNGNVSQSSLTVNVVPYITEIITQLSDANRAVPSAFNRSARGWYPVREGETIIIKGFNFFTTGTYTAPSVTIGGIELEGRAAAGAESDGPLVYRQKTRVQGTVGGNISSGVLAVTVNDIVSINNSNNNDALYNKEPNKLNNNNLNDDRRIYVWNTGDMLNRNDGTNSVVLHNPFFRMDSNARWYMSYGFCSNLFRLNNNGDGTNNLGRNFDAAHNRWHNTTVAFGPGEQIYGAGTTITRNQDTWNGQGSFNFHSRAPAGSYTAASTSEYGIERASKRRLESNFNPLLGITNADRVQIPRLAVNGTSAATRVYMSYYDANHADNPIKFRYAVINSTNVISGFENLPNTAASFNSSVGSGGGNLTIVAKKHSGNNTDVHKSGLFTAVGGLSDGRAVIAWHDSYNRTLVFSYSDDTNPMISPNWQSNARVIANDFDGWHVDLSVDDTDGIHLTWYNSGAGGLWYAYLSVYNQAVNGMVVPVRVDTYLSAGTRIMINTRLEDGVYIPYISYFHASFPQSKHSIRTAWPINAAARTKHGTDFQDRFTGDWEVMTVPAENIPMEDFVCNGVPAVASGPPTNIIAAIPVSLGNSILITYNTDVNYERAFLKIPAGSTIRKLSVD